MATIQELREMDDSDLQRWFEDHARYTGDEASPDSKYHVRPPGASLAIFDGDTMDLRNKFFAHVRGGSDDRGMS